MVSSIMSPYTVITSYRSLHIIRVHMYQEIVICVLDE
jgi:hypothetical protein